MLNRERFFKRSFSVEDESPNVRLWMTSENLSDPREIQDASSNRAELIRLQQKQVIDPDEIVY